MKRSMRWVIASNRLSDCSKFLFEASFHLFEPFFHLFEPLPCRVQALFHQIQLMFELLFHPDNPFTNVCFVEVRRLFRGPLHQPEGEVRLDLV
ncbi:MAG: hypothetical protein HQM02_13615 [Magnetococcales bacterium]|nr:hypothetical protein [Magnetococcales bacterium]